MAHQAHNIPWNVLASNLKWVTNSECQHMLVRCPDKFKATIKTNATLHPRLRPNQGGELSYFVHAFVKTIGEHSTCESAKYPAAYDPPDGQDVVLDDHVVKKISPTFQRLHLNFNWKTCGHKQNEECRCPIPDEWREASALLRMRLRNDSCYRFFEVNGAAFVNIELVKMLLLYGEMDPIFRLCAHPDVNLCSWWEVGQCPCEVSINYISMSIFSHHPSSLVLRKVSRFYPLTSSRSAMPDGIKSPSTHCERTCV